MNCTEHVEHVNCTEQTLESQQDLTIHRKHGFDSFSSGTGRTGFITVPPNNYPFYHSDEKYLPTMQADGGQLSGKALTDDTSL